MKRKIEKELLAWQENDERKPLIVYGARQVGKTYSITDFGKKYYQNFVYFNFEGNSLLSKIFENDLNPQRIILELQSISGMQIIPGKTLIFFDEIQSCDKALTSLKYFNEEANQYHIIAAGSLLGIAVKRKNYSFPVGKVNVLTMYPLDFEEFLWANEREDLVAVVKSAFDSNVPVSDPVHNLLLEYYYKYLAVGGMPACVSAFLNHNDFDYVRIAQSEMLSNYYGDMTKYTNEKESSKIIASYRSIPSQLAKENKKFQYSLVGSGARASAYESSIEWLESSGIVYRCNKINAGYFPIKIYEDSLSYKIYMNDVGLLSNSLSLSINNILSNNISEVAKGLLAENYCIEQLESNGLHPFYWESNGKAEVDFVIQKEDAIIPIECKYGVKVQAKSLKVFCERYQPKYAVRVSAKNFGFENNIKSVPLYAVFCIRNKS